MTGLEQSFYIMGLIFMSVMLILITFMVVSIIIIRNKVVEIERTMQDKLQSATKLPSKVVEIANAVRELVDAANIKV